ncbi:MAG TPA: signal peptidase II [Gemmatimonadaceae bacterium]|jgi:signal peptidase II
MPRSKPGLFWGVTAGVVAGDAFTKMVAVDRLLPAYLPHALMGESVRLTLVYNPGAAFGLHLGAQSRWIFVGLTLVALGVLARLYLDTPLAHRARLLALALVTGGALGNLLDRLKSARGVVDFIDVGVGAWRWPTFNVADIAVTSGAVLLGWLLWQADAAPAREALGTPAPERASDSVPG